MALDKHVMEEVLQGTSSWALRRQKQNSLEEIKNNLEVQFFEFVTPIEFC